MGILLTVFLWDTLREARFENRCMLAHRIEAVQNLFAAFTDKDVDTMRATLLMLREDEQLLDAFQRQDTEDLLRQSSPLFQRLFADCQITHFYFTGPDRVNLLRVHQPERNGDTINRFTTLEAERLGAIASGLELGPLGTFTLRVVQPCYRDDELIGYLELGKEIDREMDGLREALGVHLYPLIRKDLLDQEQWEVGTRMTGHVAEWNRLQEYVVVSRSPVPDGLPEFLAQRRQMHRQLAYDLDTQDRSTRVGFLPLIDVAGAEVGELMVQIDVTERLALAHRHILTATVASVVVGAALFLLLYLLLGRIERDLAKAEEMVVEESLGKERAQSQLTQQIRADRDRLQAVVDAIPSPVMVIDQNHKIQLANQVVRELAGNVDPTNHGSTCYAVSHHRETPCSGPDHECPLEQVIARRAVAKTTHCHFDADGARRTMEITAAPIFDADGGVSEIIESCYDVTERVKTVETLRLQGSALESVANAIIITNRDGRVTWVNPAYTNLTGYSLMEVVGQHVGMVASGEQGPDFYKNLWDTILAGGVWRGEIVNRGKNGSLFTVDTCITPVPDDSGAINHFVAIQQDITERKRIEAQLELATRAAQEASHAKSEFLANMSHEIRTPMTAILGFAEILLDGDQDESERAELVGIIRTNGEHLLSVINDILDLSKVEAGKMPVERVPCFIPRLLDDVRSLVGDQAAAKGIVFEISHVGTLPEVILTDPTRLRQILINLIGNALKFTNSGSVRLVLQFVDTGNPMLQFDLVDTGIGMTREQADTVFQPFSQADTSTARRFGGTGLGLALSRQFATLLGGTIVLADSQLGVGSRFQITVAAAVPTGIDGKSLAAQTHGVRTSSAPTDDSPLACRVLLAEDGVDNQRIISAFLEKAGAEVALVENGREAVDAAMAADSQGSPFDVILMDMQMPVMDGYEAVSLLRQERYLGPIVAVTAHAMVDDRAKCMEAGCDDYVTKPIHRQKLLQAVRGQLHAATHSSG